MEKCLNCGNIATCHYLDDLHVFKNIVHGYKPAGHGPICDACVRNTEPACARCGGPRSQFDELRQEYQKNWKMCGLCIRQRESFGHP